MSVLVIPEFENEDEQLLEPEEAIAQSVPDERANIPVSETAERFLRAVLAKVPLDRIEELHLFSPLRQGTAETGIAVIAARVLVPEEPVAPELELQLEAGPDVEVDEEAVDVPETVEGSDESAVDESVELEESEDAGEPLEPVEAAEAADAVDAVEVVEAADDSESVEALDESAVVAASQAPRDHDKYDESPYADETLPVAAEDVLDFAHELAPDVADELTFDPPAPRVRHTVYTARYRLVIKGPDRGKWEMDVVDEADAPLLAVETVVRGVQRRAGEETATVRYDAAQLARALRITPTPVP